LALARAIVTLRPGLLHGEPILCGAPDGAAIRARGRSPGSVRLLHEGPETRVLWKPSSLGAHLGGGHESGSGKTN
jgi:hypothetical protein